MRNTGQRKKPTPRGIVVSMAYLTPPVSFAPCKECSAPHMLHSIGAKAKASGAHKQSSKCCVVMNRLLNFVVTFSNLSNGKKK